MSRPIPVRLPLSLRAASYARARRRLSLRLESLEERAVPATGTLLVQAFVDQNQNGVQDAGESGVAGAALGFTSPGGSNSVTTGDDGSGSVEIEEGTYGYSVLAPAGYTVGGWSQIGTLTITAGQQTTVQLPLVAMGSGTGGDTGTGGTVDPSMLTSDGSDLWFSGVPVPSETENDSFIPPDSGDGTSDPNADSWDGSDDQLADPPPDNPGDDPNLPDDQPAFEAPAEPTVSLDDLPPELATAYTSSFDPPDIIEVGNGNAPPPDMRTDQFTITDDAPTDENPTPPPGTPDGSDPTTIDPPPGSTDSGDPSEPPAASDATAPTAPSVGSGQWGMMPGYHVTSGGYNRHYSQDWSSAAGASHYEATITGTIFLQAGPDGQQVPYEQVRVDYSGWNRMGTGPAMPYSGFYAPNPTPVSLNGGYSFFGLTSWGTPIAGFGMMGPMVAPVGDGPGGYSSAWNDRWDVQWNGNYLAANAVTYQFTQSFSGTDWSTSTFTPSTAADGTQTAASRNDYGGSYRSDLAESDQAGNLPAAPVVGSPIGTTVPDNFAGETAAGSTYFRRDFSAGTYSGWSLYTTVTTADGVVLRHPESGNAQSDGTTGYRYYFQNSLQVGDRNNAANAAEDRYAWLIDYQDGGTYHFNQDWNFPNEGPVFQTGTRTTDSTVTQTIATDLYDVRYSFHRAKDGSQADGSLHFRRAVDGPTSSQVHVHFVESADGGAGLQPESSLVVAETSAHYGIRTSVNTGYSLIAQGTDGQRLGVTQGSVWGDSSTSLGGHDHAIENYTFSNQYAIVDDDGGSDSNSESESRSYSTYTADNDAGTEKFKSYGWGQSKTTSETHTHGEYDGSTGKQLGGSDYEHDHAESSQNGWVWDQLIAQDVPTTTTRVSVQSLTNDDLTTDLTYTDGSAAGTISGTSSYDTTTTTNATAVGLQKFYDVAPIPVPVGNQPSLQYLPPFAMSPQRLAVNDTAVVVRTQKGKLTTDLTVQSDQPSGTIKGVTSDNTTTNFTIDHRATRDNDELNAHTVVVGTDDSDGIDTTITTTVTNGDQATTATQVRRQKVNDGITIDAKGKVNGVAGWNRSWSLKTSDFTDPIQYGFLSSDRWPPTFGGPVVGPIAGANRGGQVSIYFDNTETKTFVQNADGTWKQTGDAFDIVDAHRGGYKYDETNQTQPRDDGRSIEQFKHNEILTDEVFEKHGNQDVYSTSESLRRHAYGSTSLTTKNVDPAGPNGPVTRIMSLGTSDLSDEELLQIQRKDNRGTLPVYFNRHTLNGHRWDKADTSTDSAGQSRSVRSNSAQSEKQAIGRMPDNGPLDWNEWTRAQSSWYFMSTYTPTGGDTEVTGFDRGSSSTVPAGNWLERNGDELLRIGFGVFDVVAGFAIIGGSYGAGVVPGVGLIALGLDQIITGLANWGDGTKTPSVFEYGGQQAALAAGASPDNAQFIGSLTPAILSLGFGGWGSLARAGRGLPPAEAGLLNRGAQLQARYGDIFGEYMHFRNQGFTPGQSFYLTQRYVGMGHHFPIPQRWAGSLGIPDWLRDSPFNVLSPRGISRGRFYELHYMVDPFYPGSTFPRVLGGGWWGGQVGLQRYSPWVRWWYATPGATKLVGGFGILGGGAAGGYWVWWDW